VEVEVEQHAVGRARPFVSQMVDANRLTTAGPSKFESALIATGQVVPALTADLGPTTVAPELTAGEVAYAVLRKQFGAFRANEPGTRLGEDIEALHNMRVAIRRLRAAMAAFRPVLAPQPRYRDQLGWQPPYRRVRDLDVQLERMHEWRGNFPPERAAALRLSRTCANMPPGCPKRMLAVLDHAAERICERARSCKTA
jgi:hypothetical protein